MDGSRRDAIRSSCCANVRHAVLQACGRTTRPAESARLAEDFSFAADLTCFLPVRISATEDGILTAPPVTTNTSGDFAALRKTDGYVELAQTQDTFAAGLTVPLHRWTTP